MDNKDLKESQSKHKHRKKNENMFAFFYSSILISMGISIAIYGASTVRYSEKMMATKVYFSIMYLSSVIIILALWIYLLINRSKSYEAIAEGKAENSPLILSQRGERVNMYLLLGLAMFGISSLVYIALATYIRSKDTESTASTLAHGVNQLLFIIVQTSFILFYHRLVPLAHRSILKFAFIHLIITNVLMWANASIGKVSSEFEDRTICKITKKEIICKLCSYLQPTLSEYAVIAAAVLHEIYSRIGKTTLIELEKEEIKSSFCAQFQSGLLGIMGGTIIIVACVFTSIASMVLHILKKQHHWVYHFHSIQMILLNCLGIVCLIIAYSRIRTMKFSLSLTKSFVDKSILFVSYIMSINFSLIVLIICGRYLNMNLTPKFFDDLILRFFSAFFEIIQASLQTHIIIDWFQRCSFDSEQKEKKLGKDLLALLLGINFGMWFLWTLQVKNADIINKKLNSSFIFLASFDSSSLQGLLLLAIQSTLPLTMLFRYHSSACLSDIYAKLYQTETERFVDHFRSGKLQKQNGLYCTLAHNSRDHHTKSKSICFDNEGYRNDAECVVPSHVSYVRRCQTFSADSLSHLKTSCCKVKRRATLKNIERAHFKFISEKILHRMVNRRISMDTDLGHGEVRRRQLTAELKEDVVKTEVDNVPK